VTIARLASTQLAARPCELNAAATVHLRAADGAELPAAVDVLIDAVAGKLTVNKPGYTTEVPA